MLKAESCFYLIFWRFRPLSRKKQQHCLLWRWRIWLLFSTLLTIHSDIISAQLSNTASWKRLLAGKAKNINAGTVVPGFSVLGFRALPWFRALDTGNQIWVYVTDLPGFSALPGFRAPFCGDGQSTLNPGTTYCTLWKLVYFRHNTSSPVDEACWVTLQSNVRV